MLNKFARDLLVYLPSKLLPALTGFITVPILTRLLAPAEYGYYALAAGVYEFLFALTCSGLGAGAVRFFSSYANRGQTRTFFASLGISVACAVLAGCCLAFLALALAGGQVPAELRALLPVSVLVFSAQAAYIVAMQVVRAQERSKVYTAFELATNYGGLLLGLGLLYGLGWGARGLLWGVFWASAVGLLVLVPLMVRGTAGGAWRCARGDFGALWRFALPLALGNVAMWGLRLSDRYLLGVFRTATEVGLYSAAYNLSAKSIDILVAVFLLSLGPLVINTWERQGLGPTQEALRATTRIFLIVCLPAAVVLGALGKPLVGLLADTPYQPGYRIVCYVMFASFCYGLGQITGFGLILAKRSMQVALSQVLAMLLNLGLNVILLPRYGFVAAGITTVVAYGVLALLQALFARRYLVWPFPFKTLRNVAIAAGAAGLAAAGCATLASSSLVQNLRSLCLGGLSAALVYGIGLILLGELDMRALPRVKQTWERVTRWLAVAPSGEPRWPPRSGGAQ